MGAGTRAPTLLAGRYTLEARVGAGGMGEVWKAHDVVLGRIVAVKLLLGGVTRATVLPEARLAAKLKHPSIVTVYDAGEDGGRPYIVMEFVEGPSLRNRLDHERALPEHTVAAIGADIAGALAAAHAGGVLHNDVKPENILVPAAGPARLTDFGIARPFAATHDLHTSGPLMGTAAYVAPEVLAGTRPTERSDVYSLGVTLAEAAGLAGAPGSGSPPNSALAAAIAGAGALHARARPSAAELEHALRRLAGRTARLPATAAGPPPRARRSLALVASLPVLGAVALTGAFAWGGDAGSGSTDPGVASPTVAAQATPEPSPTAVPTEPPPPTATPTADHGAEPRDDEPDGKKKGEGGRRPRGNGDDHDDD
jgi:serine/threonine protein kinase